MLSPDGVKKSIELLLHLGKAEKSYIYYNGTTPYDAYPGDEDLGQMSSWFVMSSLGLFQMDGGCSEKPFYELASPRYPKITIRLDGKYNRRETFVIEAPSASKENKYGRSVILNGRVINDFRISQEEVLKGGKIVFEMDANKNEGSLFLSKYQKDKIAYTCVIYIYPHPRKVANTLFSRGLALSVC